MLRFFFILRKGRIECMRTFVIGASTSSSPRYTVVPFVDKWHIRSNMRTYMDSGVVYQGGFSAYKKRIAELGLCGTAFQSAPTVAISFSHRRVWQVFLQSNASLALVLEDDAVKVSPHKVASLVRKLRREEIHWNFLQLGRCWDFCDSEVTVLTLHNSTRIVQSQSPLCTHAYLISRDAARTLLHYSLPHVTSVDLLIALLSRTRRLDLLSASPPMYSQRRIKGAHDKGKLEECDRSGNRVGVPMRDDVVISFVEAPMRAFTRPHVFKVHSTREASCETISSTPSHRYADAFANMRTLGLDRIILWRNGHLFDHSSERMEIVRMLRHSKQPFKLCERVASVGTHALVISIGNHFQIPPRFHSSNRYLFYGTPPYNFRNKSGHTLQWFIINDTFSAVDSLDFGAVKRLQSQWTPDLSYHGGFTKTTDSTLVPEDVDDKTFCKFVASCPHLRIVKIGSRHPSCSRSYVFVKNTTFASRRYHFRRAMQAAFLRPGPFVPRNAYTLASMGKKVLIDIRGAMPLASCGRGRITRLATESFSNILTRAFYTFALVKPQTSSFYKWTD